MSPKILIVDDEGKNRELIQAYLEGGDFEVFEAASGSEALALAERCPPDLVLLDVMMPGMNGYDVARRLKHDGTSGHLPVVLISALTDRESRLEGLRAGADEFLSKPVDRQELLVRVGNLLTLRARERELMAKDAEHIELHRSKEEMVALLVHDLKGPLSAMIGNVDYLLAGRERLTGDVAEVLDDVRVSGERMIRLVHGLMDIARLEASRLKLQTRRASLAVVLERSVKQRRTLAASRKVTLVCECDEKELVECDPDLLTRVFENILDNAFRYAPSGGRIVVRERMEGGRVFVRIGNSGQPIPQNARTVIFEKFGQAVPGVGRMNLGLGLYFCRLAVEAHGGRIGVEDGSDLDTVFAIELPIARGSRT